MESVSYRTLNCLDWWTSADFLLVQGPVTSINLKKKFKVKTYNRIDSVDGHGGYKDYKCEDSSTHVILFLFMCVLNLLFNAIMM
jgi:hypothetical protein